MLEVSRGREDFRDLLPAEHGGQPVGLLGPLYLAQVQGMAAQYAVEVELDGVDALVHKGVGVSAGLHHLPVEEIKIDRSLLEDATVMRSTIGLAKSLDLRVVAEGIEDDHTRLRLAALGCDLGQGYLFSPPLAGAELARWAGAHVPVAA